MNSQQAQEFLRIYRPGNEDERDEQTTTALEQLATDPALQTWFDHQQSFHAGLRHTLRQITPPADLRSRLLAPPESRIIAVAWWRRPQWLALAAAVVILLGLVSLWLAPPAQDDLAGYRARMAKIALREYRMDLVTNDMAQIRAFLGNRGAPGDYRLSPNLEQLPELGCAALRWQNHPVSMICFRLNQADFLWLFVIRESSLPSSALTENPEYRQIHTLATATWKREGKVYLLAALGDSEVIRKFL